MDTAKDNWGFGITLDNGNRIALFEVPNHREGPALLIQFGRCIETIPENHRRTDEQMDGLQWTDIVISPEAAVALHELLFVWLAQLAQNT